MDVAVGAGLGTVAAAGAGAGEDGGVAGPAAPEDKVAWEADFSVG
jgi:hypothetical protein